MRRLALAAAFIAVAIGSYGKGMSDADREWVGRGYE